MKRLNSIFLLLAFFTAVWAQEKVLTVAERNAAQGFNDTIDRLDPDFVTVSLCIADPTDWRRIGEMMLSGQSVMRSYACNVLPSGWIIVSRTKVSA